MHPGTARASTSFFRRHAAPSAAQRRTGSVELTQDVSSQMGMRVSPRLVAASYILELSSQELQQAIAQEISENPAMELVEKETCPACGGPMQGSICPACLSQQKSTPISP